MPQSVELTASLEDYIEAIYHIAGRDSQARSKDIAERLGVSRSSVTEALRALARKGLIHYAPYEAITLTGRGRAAAEDVIHRHNALKRFFMEVLAIDEETAETGACRVEHAAPPEIIERMILFSDFIELCPRGGASLIEGFAEYCRQGRTRGECGPCLARCQARDETRHQERAGDRDQGPGGASAGEQEVNPRG